MIMSNLSNPLNSLKLAVAVSAMATTLLFAGCQSAQEKANEQAVAQAKLQAASTGQPQQVVYTDKDGNTITTTVQPPLPGQTTQQVTVTKTSSTTTQASVPGQSGISQGVVQGPAQGPVQGPAQGPIQGPVQGPAPAYGNGVGPSGPGPASAAAMRPADVQIPAGTELPIRVNQRISVKEAHAGDTFTGEVVRPIMSGNSVAIPAGTPVDGVIDASHKRGHFKGASLLELRLVSMSLNGQRYRLDTADNVSTKKGKGRRSAALIGGGAGAGMLIGGLASGGVGLLVGGLVGGGAGTAVGGLTGNKDIVIPAESVVNFRLADDLVVQQ